MIQQISDELVELRRTAGDLETVKRLGQICLEKTGLPFDYVKQSAPQEVLTVLGQGGSLQPIRAVILAELLLQDSELNREAGRVRDSAIERVQAGALIAASVDSLGLEDQERYRSKLAALMSELQDQSGSGVD